MLEYLEKTSGDPRNYIYAISIPIYYGGKAAAGAAGADTYSVDQILDDMRRTMDDQTAGRKAVIDLAKRYNLPGGVCAYEGGPDIGGGRTDNIENRILAIRDPRQGDLYNKFTTMLGVHKLSLPIRSPRRAAQGRTRAFGLQTMCLTRPSQMTIFATS